jgi:hypothetical protein
MKHVFGTVLVLALFAVVGLAMAGERPIGSGCTITATNPATGSSASDADCVWNEGAQLVLQCDVAVYYSKNGAAPTTSYPKVAVGDPYPLGRAGAKSVDKPVQILPVAGAATCQVLYED